MDREKRNKIRKIGEIRGGPQDQRKILEIRQLDMNKRERLKSERT